MLAMVSYRGKSIDVYACRQRVVHGIVVFGRQEDGKIPRHYRASSTMVTVRVEAGGAPMVTPLFTSIVVNPSQRTTLSVTGVSRIYV